MDEVNKIRKAYFCNGESIDSIAKRFNRSWATIDKIVKMDREQLEQRGKRPNRKKPILTDEVRKAVEQILDQEELMGVHKKQRHTTSRMFKDLRSKGIYKGSLRQLYELVNPLRVARNQSKPKGMLPLEFALGSMLQIDHGEVECIVGGQRMRGYLFVAAIPGYLLRYCQVFPTKASEAWGAFHERVFNFFGGVFTKVAYDNDTVLIKAVLGSEHRQTDFALSLEEHYGFTSHFCNVAAGNEKGAVENAVGYCRRNYLPGCPEAVDWESFNEQLDQACRQECAHERASLDALKEVLMPMPPERVWRRSREYRVDSYQLVTLCQHRYSVPERFVGTYVQVRQSVFDVEIWHEDELIAKHQRLHGNQRDAFCLDHYLNQLTRKPAALWDCKVVQEHPFEPLLMQLWNRLYQRYPLKEANRQFVQVLLLTRRYKRDNFASAIELALNYGSIESAAIENLLHQMETPQIAIDEKSLEERFARFSVSSLNFDLSSYGELCQEANHAAA